MVEAEKKIQANKQRRLATDGFLADLNQPVWKNVQRLLGEAPANKPTNMACHNLTAKGTKPKLVKHLLGLGLNFAIKSKHPTNDIEATITRSTDDVRRKYFIADNKDDFEPDDDKNYNPRLYERSKWKPPPSMERSRDMRGQLCSGSSSSSGKLQ